LEGIKKFSVAGKIMVPSTLTELVFLSPNSAVDVMGGDGGYAEISWLNPKVMFFESQYGFIVTMMRETRLRNLSRQLLMNVACEPAKTIFRI